MWVRTQSKSTLININSFSVSACLELSISKSDFLKRHISGISDNGNICILGEYSSEEKALKVLDMLEESINEPHNNDFEVFQMPQEDEV